MVNSRNDYTIAWITNQVGLEVATNDRDVNKAPEDFAESNTDAINYSWLGIGNHNVVILGVPPHVSAAQAIKTLLETVPSVRFGIFVGCAAAHPDLEGGRDIRLGDVVVNAPWEAGGGLVQYDIEAVKSGEKIKQTRFHESMPNVLVDILVDALDALISDPAGTAKQVAAALSESKAFPPTTASGGDKLFAPTYEHVGGGTCLKCDKQKLIRRPRRDTEHPILHLGLIASGKSPVSSIETRKIIEDCIGHECSCFGIAAADIMTSFPCIVVQGISRYADSHTNDKKWFAYATVVAACFTRMLLEITPSPQVIEMEKAADICSVAPIASTSLEFCRRCMNLECPPETAKLDLVIPARRLLADRADCPKQYCGILWDLWMFLTEECYQGQAHDLIVNTASQSELYIELQRGKSVIARIGKRTVPKAPGSPIMRADREDSRRLQWMKQALTLDSQERDRGPNSRSKPPMLNRVDMYDPTTTRYVEFDFDAGSKGMEKAPRLCMLHVLSDSTGEVLSDVARASAWTDDIGSKQSVMFIKNCIKACGDGSGVSHADCQEPVDQLLPTRILNVSEDQIRLEDSTGAHGKYCALSYRWGPPEFNYKTTNDNIDQLKTEGVPCNELPDLIRDAITVTRQLGINFLWVDALCILQKNEEETLSKSTTCPAAVDFALECPKMGSYYQNAYVTLCPSFAEDVRSSFICPRVRANTTSLADIKETRLRTMRPAWPGEETERRQKLDDAFQNFTVFSIDYRSEATLGVCRPGTSQYTSIMASSPLAKRGWAWQENILSSRIVHFTPSEVVFECRSGVTFENTDHISLQTGQSRKFVQLRSDPEAQWKRCVTDFSRKDLTEESDRLPAVSGIATLMSLYLKGPYLAGLWADWLDTDLLWYPVEIPSNLTRASPPIAKTLTTAPTWSWASLNAPVNFPVHSTAEPRKLELVSSLSASGSDILTMDGYIVEAGLVCNAFALKNYRLRFQGPLEQAIVYSQFQPDGMLVQLTDGGGYDTFDRLREKLPEPSTQEGRSDAEDGSNLVLDVLTDMRQRNELNFASRDTWDEDDEMQYFQMSALLSVLNPNMIEGVVTADDWSKPDYMKLEGNILCLLLTEQVSKAYPAPFGSKELAALEVDLGCEQPDTYNDLFIPQESPMSKAAVNQWYLVLGADKTDPDSTTCWRVGVLNLMLQKKVDLDRKRINLR